MGPNVAVWWSSAGPTTDLSGHEATIERLSSDPNEAGAIVRGVLIHDYAATTSGLNFTPEVDGMAIRSAASVLDKVLAIDDHPLDVERPPDRRMIGFCYHFALLHCALLRYHRVAARTRCGFASYLEPDKWADH